MSERKTKIEKNEELDEEPKAQGETYETDLSTLVPYTNLQGHVWHQEGPCLICSSCAVRHATMIGIDKRLMGFDDDGNPIIKKIEKL